MPSSDLVVGVMQIPNSVRELSADSPFCLQILYYTNDQLYKNGPQADRLSLLYDPPTLGSASIQLSKVRASDAGTYTCQVNNPPDFSGSGFGLIHFTVLSKHHFNIHEYERL